MKSLQRIFFVCLVFHFCGLSVFASQLSGADRSIDKTEALLLTQSGFYLPDFRGEYYKNACRQIEYFRRKCEIVWETTPDKNMNNRVLYTYPPGDRLVSSKTITLHVGNYRPSHKEKDVQGTTVPDVMGMNYEAACKTLKREYLECIQQGSYRQGFQGYHGIVFEQNPRAGTKVSKGSPVYIRWYTN